MREMFRSPRTTAGGFLCLAGVGMLYFQKINMVDFVTLMGIAAAWIGISAKDAGVK